MMKKIIDDILHHFLDLRIYGCCYQGAEIAFLTPINTIRLPLNVRCSQLKGHICVLAGVHWPNGAFGCKGLCPRKG
jgi:hypothetical protein